MADEHTATVRIRRPAKVRTDDRGHTVWVDTVMTAQLELVSTRELKQLLESDDENTRSAIQQMVLEEQDGVLARDPATGLFEVISDADLQAVLDNEDAPKVTRPAEATVEAASETATEDELSLVSTQMLRKVLLENVPGTRQAARPAKGRAGKKDEGGGFDPYDTG